MTLIDLTKATEINRLGLMNYKLLFYHPTLDPSRRLFDLTPLIQLLRWSDDINQAAMEITVQLAYHDAAKNVIDNGGILTLFGQQLKADNTGVFGEILRGVVFEKSLVAKMNYSSMEFTAYDHMIYFVKNDLSRKFSNKKASDIVKYICEYFQMPMGTIEDTSYIIPSMIFRKATPYDMIIEALTEDRWVTGNRYVLRMIEGKLNLFRKQLAPKIFYFEYGVNIYAASMTESIKDMKNRVILYTAKDQGTIEKAAVTQGIIENSDMTIVAGGDEAPIQNNQKIADYGLMQMIEVGDTPTRFDSAIDYAKHLLESNSKVRISGNVEAPNVNTLRWGDAIYIKEPLSGLGGQFYIQSASHTITPEKATMDLIVVMEDLLPEQFYAEDKSSSANDLLKKYAEKNGIIVRRTTVGSKRAMSDGEVTVPPLDTPYQITQPYGANPGGLNPPGGHTGIDMANGAGEDARGKPVYSVAAGKVIFAGLSNSISGTEVNIEHPDGYISIYAHLDAVIVSSGDPVITGQAIGVVGDTGSARRGPNNVNGGPHLHFEVHNKSRQIIDPEEIVVIT